MRAAPLTVTALAAALLLTACDSSSDDKDSGGPTQSSTSACEIGDMGVQVGPANTAPAAGDTGNIPVTLTNNGSKCTLEGFPAIDLNAADMSTTVPQDKGAKSQKLTLAKDATVTFTITYVRGEAGGKASLDVKTLNVGLPGGSTDNNSKWSYGPVQTQNGSQGDVNASVSAFSQAGD
ncbi:DUF4232 domain-containing protein [Streptomyces fulvoviolaceus]|uniref:DUF4232 domain-containing protein n=1 Tax=Streptomyces fulvoviolaceus TaxID=285535 RepID=UPI0004CA0467|nr:DUF4232 domain-containing protein [Streptomyces fulvoviolaceus]